MNNNFEKLYNYILNNKNKLNINLITDNIFYIETNKINKCKSKYLNLEYNNNFDKLLKEQKNILNNFNNNLPTIHFILFKIIETINNISKLICLHESDYFVIFNNKECICKCKNQNNENNNISSNVSICIDVNEILIQLNKENTINLILKSINNSEYNNTEKLNEPLWNLIIN